jgi:tetratricopeptide (TPR) repeat protein
MKEPTSEGSKAPARERQVAQGEPTMINDRYHIVRELGRGGMGQVYLVEDLHRENQLLALKTLLPQTTDHVLRAGFREEFAGLARLRHENLAAAYDFGRVSGKQEYFFTTEFIDGIDLARGTAEASMDQLLDVTVQLLRVLDFIHSHGLLHNDIKPANVLLQRTSSGAGASARGDLEKLESVIYGRSGRVKLIDFGLISREHSRCEKILGTLRYISPERIQRAPADRRSDLYSLGIMLYVLFTRRYPFDHGDSRTLLKLHLESPPPPIKSLRKDLPGALPELIHRLLEKRPEDRFASAGEALDLLARSMGWEVEGGAPERTASTPGWSSSPLRAGTLLHREAELKLLADHFDGVLAGSAESHAVLVQGAEGVGKSRLVQEMRGHVQLSGGAFVEVCGPAIEGNLQPLADAFVAGLQTSGAAGLDQLRSHIDAGRASGNLSDSLEKLILMYTRHVPLLLHLDDFDRASETVRRFALELVHAADCRSGEEKSVCRLLVVLSRRTAAEKGDLRISGLRSINLENFSAEQVRTFLEQLFSQEEIPPPFVEALVRISSGNPLFILELVNSLIERKELTFSGARWAFPRVLEGTQLPDSLAHLLESRLDALGEGALEVLFWVAASGQPLPHGVLARCVKMPAGELEDVLKTLAQRSLLAATVREGVTEYRLSHPTSRETLHQRIGPERLRALHQRLAQNIEAEYPEWKECADALAEHWDLAGNEAGFLRFAPHAAELLRRRGDFERAVQCHQRIVRSTPDNAVAKKVQSLARLSEMHEFLWDLDGCRQDILQIQRLSGNLLKPVDRALLLRRLACVEMASQRFAAADALLADAGRMLEGASPFVRLSVLAPRAWTSWFTGEHDTALRTLQESSSLLQALVPSGERELMLLAGAANQIANLEQQLGNLENAANLLSKNIDLLAGKEQQQAIGATLCSYGSVLLDLGRYREAAERLREAQRIGKEIGDLRTLCRVRERLGDYHLRFGQFREALQVTQIALQDAEGIKNHVAVASSLRTLGRIYLSANQMDDAFSMLRRALALHGDGGDILSGNLSRIHLARFHLEQGDPGSACSLLRLCDGDARRHGLPVLEGHCALWSFAARWMENGAYEEKLLESARAIFSRHGYHGELLDLLLASIEVALQAARLDDARRALAELETLTGGYKEPELSSEAAYFRALLALREGKTNSAPGLLNAVRKKARNQSKLLLAHRCEEALQAMAQAV